MTHGSSLPSLDLSAIDFPTDRITIKDIRRAYPQMFVGLVRDGGAERVPTEDIDVFATVTSERELAKAAFAQALKGLSPHSRPRGEKEYRTEEIGLLNDDYMKYGLSSGLHETRLLVEAFERAAAAQARPQGHSR